MGAQVSNSAEGHGASRMARLMSFFNGLPPAEKQIFRDSFFEGKAKAQVCRERGIAGADFDQLGLRFMRLMRGLPATPAGSASAAPTASTSN